MSSISVRTNKHCVISDKSNQYSDHVIATVTKCLAMHPICTGRYVDFSFKYAITCHCECHSKKQKALDSVDGPAANAKGNKSSFQEGTQNDYQ